MDASFSLDREIKLFTRQDVRTKRQESRSSTSTREEGEEEAAGMCRAPSESETNCGREI